MADVLHDLKRCARRGWAAVLACLQGGPRRAPAALPLARLLTLQRSISFCLRSFLKVHPHLPSSDLGLRNTREEHLERKGRLEDGQEVRRGGTAPCGGSLRQRLEALVTGRAGGQLRCPPV